jgi:hypothetical protein
VPTVSASNHSNFQADPIISDVNSSQSRSEIDSISNIIFKGIVSPAGGVNLTYVNYLVNQSQVEMETGVVKCKQTKNYSENGLMIFPFRHEQIHNDNDYHHSQAASGVAQSKVECYRGKGVGHD